jgi:hypothetical protein
MVMTRRLTHTSHHRGQQMAMLRMLGRTLHSTYGPTADTGGLMQGRRESRGDGTTVKRTSTARRSVSSHRQLVYHLTVSVP